MAGTQFVKISNMSIFSKSYSIYPSREMCGICLGVEFTNQFQAIEDEQEKLSFLNHVNDVLMNPNPTDAARSI